MHSEVFTPHPLMPQSLRKRTFAKKPGNLLQSDEQLPRSTSQSFAQIPWLQVAQISA